MVFWLCPSLSFPPASKVVVIVVYLFVFSRDSVVKCTCDAVLGRGVGGHITLCISRAGVEVIALVLPLVGAVGIWETQFLLSWLELIHFQHIKARSSRINEGEQMGRFFGGGGGVNPVDWRAVIVGFHASLAEKA